MTEFQIARKQPEMASANSLNSPVDRPRVAQPAQRSRITNGRLLPGDNRSAWVRRCKDLIAAHTQDLGGEENVSAAERSIIRRACVMTVELERLEAKFATAGEADADELDQYARVAANLRRLFEALGLKRVAKDITPNLETYLSLKAQPDADDR